MEVELHRFHRWVEAFEAEIAGAGMTAAERYDALKLWIGVEKGPR